MPMIPQLEIIKRPLDRSFIAHTYAHPQFDFVWHRHPQIELTLIQAGRGQRFVGNSIESFEPGDLVLLGSNLPHTWMAPPTPPSSPRTHTHIPHAPDLSHAPHTSRQNVCAAVVIFFERHSFGSSFFKLPEMAAIDRLLNQSEHGLVFDGQHVPEIRQAVSNLTQQDGPSRILNLIAILYRLAECDRRALSTPWKRSVIDDDDCSRLDQVCAYLNTHYTRDIRLDELATMLHMTPPGFCRFFKRMMGRTLISYLHELRIAEVCRLLAETDRSITDIAYACGFANLAHFNRIFKRLRNENPRAWRRRVHTVLTSNLCAP